MQANTAIWTNAQVTSWKKGVRPVQSWCGSFDMDKALGMPLLARHSVQSATIGGTLPHNPCRQLKETVQARLRAMDADKAAGGDIFMW